jgi:hypothetical protein
MRTQPIGIIFFVLSSAGLAFGQGAPPTGVQRNGSIGLLRSETMISLLPGTPPTDSTTDNATGGFVSTDYTNYMPPPAQPFTTIGPCIAYSLTLPLPTPPPTGLVTTTLDAGPVINLNGPDGTKQIPQTMGYYFAQVGGGTPLPFPIPGLPGVLPPYLDPGTYTVDNGGGGADVGPFSTTLNVPSPGFVWTNADANLTVTLSAGVDIQWSGGDPTTNVQIQGLSSIPTQAGGFTCSVPNNGEFLVTPDVLAFLPASIVGGAPGTSTSLLTVSNSSIVNFSAPGLDLGIFSYESGSSRQVVYQ